MTPAESLLAEARAAGITLAPAPGGELTVRFAGPRPDELLTRMKPFKAAITVLVSGRTPEQCAGCELHPSPTTPAVTEFAAGCGWRDCPHRTGPPPAPIRAG
jgi:hypothetical protein